MTKIIAHRGANAYAPQNTVPAFKKALEIGCDGFENDVHLTADGELVVCHNYTVDDTSDGSGRISEMTLAELRALDFGSYFSPDFKGTRIPIMAEFYELCGGLDIINVEIKAPENHDDNPLIVKKTIDLAYDHSLQSTLLISSFSPDILRECKKYDPSIKTALLYSDPAECDGALAADPAAYCSLLGCSAVHPHYSLVDEAYIKSFHSSGMAVNPWTVDKPEDIARLAGWGCDAVITDVPDVAGEVLVR